MDSKYLNYLKKKEQHIEQFLTGHSEASRLVPYAQDDLENTKWTRDAIENMPKKCSNSIPPETLDFIKRDYNLAKKTYPLMPKYDINLVTSTSSNATASTATIYDLVAEQAYTANPEAIKYSKKYTTLYRNIQTKQQRPYNVRQRMEIFCSASTLQRFDLAKDSYSKSRVRVISHREAASSIRTTLDGLQGDLFQMASNHPKENMTWNTMADRLAKGGLNSIHHQEIIRQGTVRSTLYTRLSDIYKDRESSRSTNLDDVWTQTLDHIYTVLGLLQTPSV